MRLALGLRDPGTEGVPADSSPSRPPALSRRLAFAAAVATPAAFLSYVEPLRGGALPDFSQAWFGAVALLHGGNPYNLIGPGLVYNHDFHSIYPLTSSVVVLPLGLLPELAATFVFVWISTALFAYAMTRDGWHRLPVFLSSAFVIAARRGQWSPLLTAAYSLPWLAWTLPAKPNIGLAVFASFSSKRMVKVAVFGGGLLCLVSLALLPTWPRDWLSHLNEARHTAAPIMQRGGFLVLLALLRWRRPEARMLVALACIPQSMYWYDILPLFLIPATFRESLVLALVSSTGLIFEGFLLDDSNLLTLYRDFNSLIVAVAYLPATIMVLRRPNVGAIPFLRKKLPERSG
ncbi:MAG: hypothetical protein ABI681_06055 [Gemmatimonadales bacterium]